MIESWADLPSDARKRRAAEASQHDDRTALRSLLTAYVGLHGRRGTDTSPRTLDTYWRGSQHFLDWSGRSGVKPHQVGEPEARRFLASLASMNPKSRQVYLTGARSLVAALRWAGLGTGDPFASVKVTDPTAPAEKADPYSVEELRKILAEADPRERALTLLAADGGLRLAEVASLTWAGVDFQRKQLTIRGKGGKVAKVAATDRLTKALKALDRDGESVLGVSRRRIQQIFDRLCDRAGVKARGYHALRHSCGTRLYRTTRDLLVVQRHLRHSSARTSEIYAHLSAVDYRKAVAGLEGNGAGE
ncbi:MAG: site-specific integrase [Anaerolineales bacterium]|nr:site-specific integrase [Anaerolineales bacterium]